MELLTDQREDVENPKDGDGESTSVLDIPGAQPLKNRAHERYCREASILTPKLEAYRRAYGYVERELSKDELHAMRGNASKLERRPDVHARIAFLTRQPEEILAAKRRRLEEFLWLIHETNYADLWEIAEKEKTDKEGDPILDDAGKPVMVRYQRLKFMCDLPPELQRAVESLKYTDSGKPNLTMYSKMQANQELRKLLGIGFTSDNEGGDFGDMSDAQIVRELSRLANEVGANLTLTIGNEGAQS